MFGLKSKASSILLGVLFCSGTAQAVCYNMNAEQYPKGTKWNIIPCPNGKYCCSVDRVSADCCAAEEEEDTFEVSFGRVRDSTTTSYQTNWVTTPTTVTLLSATTYTRTATETVCPTVTETETLASDAAAASTVAPALAASFTA
ncbi:hypothetical protein SLS58_003190 [Diplodia intermedia]|uniref:Uncharacterized protein n=1 Tax=Diplodia intermedia TaxID=856260 RepID=A0ABR3TX42_9PEZI